MKILEARCAVICGGNTEGFCGYSGPVTDKPTEARLIDSFNTHNGGVNVFACEGMRPSYGSISKLIQQGCSDFKPLPSPERP